MAQAPQILIADFEKPDITYRVAASRAQQYCDLIATARRIYSRPAEEYTAHVHFHQTACDGRVAQAEWNEGWYFGPEFFGGKELVVYVHFERLSLLEKIEMAKRELGLGDGEGDDDEREVVRLRGVGDEKAGKGMWWEAVWWWRMARGVEVRIEAERRKDEDGGEKGVTEGTAAHVKDDARITEKVAQPAEKKGFPDFVKEEILEVVRGELSGAVHISLSERLRNEIADVVKESVSEALADRTTEMVQNEIYRNVSEQGFGRNTPRRKRRRITEDEDTLDPVPEDRLDPSNFPWPITYPSQLPPPSTTDPPEITTVDAYATKTHHTDLIVGRALPSSCRDPNIRPLVRAKLVPQAFNTFTKYNVCLYIPATYGKATDRTGDMQIVHGEVEYLPSFAGRTQQERSAKMAAALKMQDHADIDTDTNTTHHTTSTLTSDPPFTTIDTYTGTPVLNYDILIGHARPEICADPSLRPVVRASLTNDDRAVAYIPARYGVDRNRGGGELLVRIRDVKVWREFDAVSEAARRERIREALVRKRAGVGVEMEAEGESGEMDG